MATPRPRTSSRLSQASSEGETEPDEIIGDFQRGKEIGRGSFATVYLARHRKKKSYAAVKVVTQGRLSPKLKGNLYSEIDIMKSIDHPHIVALFTCQETPRHFYLIMEYCQLSDLSQFLKKRQSLASLPETADIFRRYPNPPVGGFNEVLSRHFMKQMASALEFLRSKNLMHRDIKPQNLLLNPAPSYMYKQRPEDVPLAASEGSLVPKAGVQSLPMIKIADFGFARHLPQTSMAETLCGSPLYMAPEILRYEKYGARADLWSAGGVLYEMVIGKPPFRAPNHVDLLRRIEKANDNITFDKALVISRPMKDLIRALLKKNPLERMSHEELLADPVITGEIPGLVEEDRALQTLAMNPDQPEALELSRRMAKQAINAPTPLSSSPEPAVRPKRSQDGTSDAVPRKSSDQETKPRPEDTVQRKTSTSKQNQADTAEKALKRRPSQHEQPKQTRPAMIGHVTAPGRQELLAGQGPAPTSAPRMERRSSRTSPLAGPPMVREPTYNNSGVSREDDKALREARERVAQDIAFEKEYVVVEKRAVEINAFADELDANRGSPQGAIVRRATTQGQAPALAGIQPPSPSRGMIVATRPTSMHQRGNSFERRYAPSPQSATNMLTKALNAANVRLFGALGTSPPFGKGASPPRGYGAYPAYPTPHGALLLGDGTEGKTPMDEDTKIVRTMEDAAHRSDVIFGFAEVKYKQLIPATPSAQDALGIQQIGGQEKQLTSTAGNEEEEDKDMTTVALVGVAEEALVLYVKTLAILAKTIDLAGYWWNKQGRTEAVTSETASKPSGGNVEVGKRMNNVVQWARERFNVCLEKSEVVGRRLQAAQWQLPTDHAGHPNNQTSASSATSGGITTSAEHIQITSGVTAEKLMFDRAVEMSRASAVAELVGDDLHECEIGYITAIMLLEAALESDDEPLMRKSSAKKDKPAEQIINGMETEDRQTVIKLIEGAKSRLNSLRKKMQAAQEQSIKRSSTSGSGNATPKAARVSPAATPAVVGTPPN